MNKNLILKLSLLCSLLIFSTNCGILSGVGGNTSSYPPDVISNLKANLIATGFTNSGASCAVEYLQSHLSYDEYQRSSDKAKQVGYDAGQYCASVSK